MAKKSINIRAGFDLKAFSTSSQNLQRQLRSSGKKMKSIGKSMSMSLTAPIVALGGLATKTFADFEQSMAKVQAISGAVGKDFQNLTNLAKDLGISTRFSATQVSDLMLNYSKLGFSADEIQKITKATLNLALATGEDLAQSAEVAGATLRGFGLDATEMTMVTDVMAKSFSSSALDLNKFQVAMSSVAPVARNAGVTLQETTSMLGVLANNGVEASTSGTALRNIFLELAKQGMSFDDAMAQINGSTNANATAMELFGKRGAAVASILARNQDAVAGLNTELIESAGAAEAMAKIMDDTLEGAMFKLKSATEGLGISFGEVLAPHISKAADFVSKLATKMSKLTPKAKKIIAVVAGLLAVVGPLVLVFGGLLSVITFIIGSPIVSLIAGISGVATIMAVMSANVADSASEIDNLTKSQQILTNAQDKHKNVLSSEKALIDEYFQALRKTNKGSKDRVNLIDTINKTYGTTLKNLEDETAFTQQLDNAYKDLTKSIRKKIATQLAEEGLSKLVEEEMKLMNQLEGFQKELQKITGAEFGKDVKIKVDLEMGEFEDPSKMDFSIDSKFAKKDLNLYKELNTEIIHYNNLLAENKKAQDKITNTDFFKSVNKSDSTLSTLGVGDGVSATIDVIKEKYKSLGDIFDSLKTKSNDFFKPFVGEQSEAFDKISKSIDKYGNKLLESVGIMKMFSNAELGIQTKISELQELVQYLNQEIEKLVEDSAVMLGEFLGDAMTGEADAQDFGRGLLNAVGKFLQQMGAAMIAFGISFDSFTKAIALGPGGAALAIAGGIAMVAAGAAISNLSKKGIDNSSNTSPTSMSGGGMRGMVMQPISLETKISGRDLILVQNREKGFTR